MSETKNKEILAVIDTVANAKGVPEELIFQAMEEALAAATKKKHPSDIEARVAIDRETGNYDTFRVWTVIEDEEELENSDAQILLKDALHDHPEIKVGDTIEESIASVEFGRIAAQTAKHILTQKVREAERLQVAGEYEEKLNTLVSGVVKRTTRDYVILDLGNNAEGLIARDQMLPRENVRMGDRVRAYLYEVNKENPKGPQILLSRTHKGMLLELFKIEVPEIGEEVIDIRGAARDPGSRAKIAVKTNDGRIDPVGACVGMRGSRVQAVSGELGGERIDIILWDDNPVQLVINAMAPAEVSSIMLDEDANSMDIAVKEVMLSQAIGRNGQNIMLAQELSGWKLNVMTEEQAEEKSDQEAEKLVSGFITDLGLEEALAVGLVEEGFGSVEDVAYAPTEEFLSIEGFDEELAESIRTKAKNVLLTKAIAKEEALGGHQPSEDLLNLDGMDEELAFKLADRGIVTQEDLAEQSIDELLEVEGMTKDRAGQLIMTARAPWFE
ncbi:MAG: transcription termination factor NusA [Gammaproteobacteria bacterium]